MGIVLNNQVFAGAYINNESVSGIYYNNEIVWKKPVGGGTIGDTPTARMPDGKLWTTAPYSAVTPQYQPPFIANRGYYYKIDEARSIASGVGGGWRLPTKDDWDGLAAAVGNSDDGFRKLMAVDSQQPNQQGLTGNTNTTGFSGIKSGFLQTATTTAITAPEQANWWVDYGASYRFLILAGTRGVMTLTAGARIPMRLVHD